MGGESRRQATAAALADAAGDPHPAGAATPEGRSTAHRTPISRGASARQRVLQAALQVLDDDGLPGFSMQGVARRAGASKATLYRHWPTAGALLVDAMDTTFRPLPVPDTGVLRTDLQALLTALVALLEHSFPRLLAAFIDAAERDPGLATLHADLTRRRREPFLIVLARAQERGELPHRLDAELATDLLVSPFFYRRFIAHEAVPTERVDQVITHVLTSLSPPREGEQH